MHRKETIVVMEDFYADDFWECIDEGGDAEEFFESHEVVISMARYIDYRLEFVINKNIANSEIKHLCLTGGYLVVFVDCREHWEILRTKNEHK